MNLQQQIRQEQSQLEQVVSEAEGRTRLTFDYRLRPGLATTRNALKLLDAVGLGGLVRVDGDEDEGAAPDRS